MYRDHLFHLNYSITLFNNDALDEAKKHFEEFEGLFAVSDELHLVISDFDKATLIITYCLLLCVAKPKPKTPHLLSPSYYVLKLFLRCVSPP